MKKFTLLFILFGIVQLSYSQTQVVYYQNFETWTNGAPTNWGGPFTNIDPGNTIANQYLTNPTNTSAKFFGNSVGETYVSTPHITVDKRYYYYIHYKFRTNSMDTSVGYDIVMNINSEVGPNAYTITLSSDSSLWYEQIILFKPSSSTLNAELRFKITPDAWLELDEIYIYKTISQDTLNINNIGAIINSNGNFFNKSEAPGFYFPKNTPKTTIFSSNLWIGGYDVNEEFHFAGQKYYNNGFYSNGPTVDFSFGPVSTDTSFQYNILYDKVWKINKSDIDYHITHFNDPNYIMPASIAYWPAHGRMDYGEMWILAPFVDIDNNNMYNPENGDYPKIRGDQAVFFIINDQRFTHGSGSQKLGVQINCMAYSYDAPNSPYLYNTVFMHFDIYNRSTYDYHNLFIGTFTDFEIGFADDDYIGCDTLRNMCYGYNGDIIDGTGFPSHYGANPPIQGLVSLNNPMGGFISFNNSNSPIGDPITAIEYYYYLTGRFKDGTHLTYGGNGYSGYLITNYMYPGNPMDYSNNSWTELNVNNAPFDRRGVMSSGPFTLNAGQNMYYDIAFPVIMTTNNEFMNISGLQSMVDSIHTFYNNMNYVLDTTNTHVETFSSHLSALIAPNPNNGQFTCYLNFIPDNSQIEFYNALGQLIKVERLDSDMQNITLNNQKGFVFYVIRNQNKVVCRGKLIVN